jgi:glycine/D-amino acid oxidase-like deaminating enzyme
VGAPIAVVGGGLAGLAAGVALAAAGAEVTLFERSRLLGGRATSFTVDGHEVDNGQHVFLACCTEFRAFAAELGFAGSLHLQDRFQALIFAPDRPPARLRAAPLPAPLDLALGLARSPRGDLAGWLDRHGQSERARRAFWEPFFVPALNAPLEEISATEAAFVVATAFLGAAGAARFGWLTVPLIRLAEAAAARLAAVHLRAPIAGLELEGGRLRALCDAEGHRHRCRAAVLAVSPDRAARLLAGGAPVPGLERFRARAIVDVHLWHDRGPLGFEFGALLDSPVQWVFEKAPGYLCCSLSSADELVRCPEAELVERCWAEVSCRLQGLRGARLLRGAATRNPEATYRGEVRPGPRTGVPNLVLAGSWTDTGWPDTMESAVRSGRAAAAALQEGGIDG